MDLLFDCNRVPWEWSFKVEKIAPDLLADTADGVADGDDCNTIGAVGTVEIAQALIALSRTSKLDSNANPTNDVTEVIDAKKKNKDTSHFFFNRMPRMPYKQFEVQR